MLRRHLLTLSVSAVVHVVVVGVALVVAGVGAGSAMLMDLVADVEDRASDATRPSPATGPAVSGLARDRAGPARGGARLMARHDGGSPAPASPNVAPHGAEVAEPSRALPAAGPPEAPRVEAPREGRGGEAASPRLPADVATVPPEVTSVPDSLPTTKSAAPDVESGANRTASGRGTTFGAASDGKAQGAGGQDTAGDSAGGNEGPAVAMGTGGAAAGEIPPEYGPYLQRFRRRVQESLNYPLAARRQGLAGNVELEVLLEPSGRVGAVRVIRSSSYDVLDDAALDAVKRLAPEPIPENLPHRPLRIRLPLGFQLR